MNSSQSRSPSLIDSATFVVGALYIAAIATDGWALNTIGILVAPSNVLLGPLVALLALQGRLRAPSLPAIFGLIVVACLAIFACFFAENIPDAILRVCLLAFYMFGAAVLLLLAKVPRFSHMILAALTLVVSLSLSLLISGEVAVVASNRFSLGETYNPTWYAAMVCALALASACFFRQYGSIGKVVFLAGALSAAYLVLATQGRSALISTYFAVLVGSVLSAFRFGNNRAKTYAVLIVSITLVLGIIISFRRYELAYWMNSIEIIRLDRVALLLTGDRNQATAGRVDIWISYLEYIGRSWFIPAGPNEAAIASGVGRPTENTYLAVIVDFGPIMLMLWLAFHVRLVYVATTSRSASIVALALFPVFLSFGNDIIYYKYYWYTVGLILAVNSLSTGRSAPMFGGRSISKQP